MSTISEATALDVEVAAAAARLRPLAVRILKEAIRIPADHVGLPVDQGGDPSCGLSNHEGPRLEYLRRTIVEIGAVRDPGDVAFDAFGNLVWSVHDPFDGVPPAERRVVWFDGHSDTVRALRPEWVGRLRGIDAYDGLVDEASVDMEALRRELGFLPTRPDFRHLVFGRGAADQLAGVVAQMIATKILVDLTGDGALRGVLVRSYATVAEEDNDGGAPMYVLRHELPGAPELVPDLVVLTEGTGDAHKGALGIYRGQRGRMQIEVVVTGRSCHGSMPWEGLNPLEHGAAIIAEAARRYEDRDGFADDTFLGHGTRVASWAQLETPSDCAVPARFTFRFDRRLTVGERWEQALADVDGLEAVARARRAGLGVEVSVPRYAERTWRGFTADNPQVYPGWLTPLDHPGVRAAVAAYRGVVTPNVEPSSAEGGTLRAEPRVDRWIFSTDGVGYVVPADGPVAVPARKQWIAAGGSHHPAMIGIGAGIEQNTHKIGEYVDVRELQHAIAVMARLPSALVAEMGA